MSLVSFTGATGLSAKPVSLRGNTASQKKDAAREAALARAERAAQKAANHAATTLQRFFRGRCARQSWRARLRAEWDANEPDMLRCNRALLAFYNPAFDALDAGRLTATLQRNVDRWDATSPVQRRHVMALAKHAQHLLPTEGISIAFLTLATPAFWAGNDNGADACVLGLVRHGFFRALHAQLSQCSTLPAHVRVLLGRIFHLADAHPFVCDQFVRELVAMPTTPSQLSLISVAAQLPAVPFFRALGDAATLQGCPFSLWTLVNSATLIQPLLGTYQHELLSEFVRVLTDMLQHVPAHALMDLQSLQSAGSKVVDDDDDDDEGKKDARLVTVLKLSAAEVELLTVLKPRLQHLLDRDFVAACLLVLDAAPAAAECVIVSRFSNQLLRLVENQDERVALLGALAFRPGLLRALWRAIVQAHEVDLLAASLMSREVVNTVLPLLHLFLDCYAHLLVTLDDADFHGPPGPLGLSLDENVRLISFLRDVAVRLIVDEAQPAAIVRPAVLKVLHFLHIRDVRRPFCPAGHWLSADAVAKNALGHLHHVTAAEFKEGCLAGAFAGGARAQTVAACMRLLRLVPFTVEFTQRARLFHQLVASDRAEHADERVFGGHGVDTVTIRRTSLYADAFDHLNRLGQRLRQRLRIRMINVEGLEEAGIDGGGLSREFLQEVLKQGFNPDAGFFRPTDDEHLYPSPAGLLVNEDPVAHYEFLGRMVGKALYDGMLVDIPFAGFFLTKLVGHSPYVNDLVTLDPVLHQSLLFLKSFQGDFSSLALDFSVTENRLGTILTHDLMPGGRNIPVTRQNRLRYIYYMADFRLNREIRQQTAGFKRGLAELINAEWLTLFDASELQMLISGVSSTIDVADLKLHMTYAGAYHADHLVIRMFWRVFERFSEDERRSFVKFVTSSPRPPLMGFGFLVPPMCIYPAGQEGDRLPSAATCMNLLKLPAYESEEQMYEKILYAINAGAGFELS